MKKNLFFIVLLCVLVLQASKVYADGKYYPEKAYKKPPSIPSQRAILIYKDGVEKLIIESALHVEGKEFGWIIPVPSRPTEFEKASPGFLKTLSLTIEPKITHDLTLILEPVCIIAAGITLCYLVLLAGVPRIVEFLLVFSIVVALLSMLMPTLSSSLGTHGGTESSLVTVQGVTVQEVQRIGSYQLVVLEADTPDALDKWLSSNGFAGLSEQDEPIISDYIRKNWFFVAAKLRRAAGGYSMPHPLAITFQSKIPVYPMRLTSTVGSDVYVELFVISDKTAGSDRLPLEVSDKFHFKEKLRQTRFQSEPTDPGFVGKAYRQMVGHPDAAQYMWEGCVISKLCRTLRPDEMTRDIRVKLSPAEPYSRHYFSRQGAIGTALLFGVNAWWILLILLTILQRKKIPKKTWRRFLFFKAIVPSAIIALVVCGTTFGVLPKIEVQTQSQLLNSRTYWLRSYWNPANKDAIARGFNYFKGMNRDEVAAELEHFLKFLRYKNPITSERTKHEDSPGNYTIFTTDEGIIFRTYSRAGFPDDFLLKAGAHLDWYGEQEEMLNQLITELVETPNPESRKRLFEKLLNTYSFGRAYILVTFYKSRPGSLVPFILEDFQRLRRDLKDTSDYDYHYDYDFHVRKIDYAALMLACIAQIEPPADVTNRKETDHFVEKIQDWYNSADRKK